MLFILYVDYIEEWMRLMKKRFKLYYNKLTYVNHRVIIKLLGDVIKYEK